MPKHKHWTQTPTGRKKLKERRILKATITPSGKARQKAIDAINTFTLPSDWMGLSKTPFTPKEEIEKHHVAYILGKVEAQIEFYAARQNISASALASKLGEILRDSESR